MQAGFVEYRHWLPAAPSAVLGPASPPPQPALPPTQPLSTVAHALSHGRAKTYKGAAVEQRNSLHCAGLLSLYAYLTPFLFLHSLHIFLGIHCQAVDTCAAGWSSVIK